MTSHVKIAGTWKDVAGIHAKVGGAWKEVSEGYTRVDGSWNQFYSLAPASSFDLLETQVLTSNQASVTFSSLSTYAADYQHLQVRFTARTNSTGRTTISVRSRLNGDTGSNYNGHGLGGNGSSVFSFSTGSTTSAISGIISTADITANAFGGGVIDLLDPFSTTKFKTFRTLSGTAGGNRIDLHSGLWRNTDAATSWTVVTEADLFITGSRFSLYGIRGS